MGAEEDVVLNAWQAHMTFTKNAYRFRRHADLIYYTSLVLTMLAASVAVVVTKNDYMIVISEELEFDFTNFCKRLLLAIPIASSVLAAIVSKKRMMEKWGTLKT